MKKYCISIILSLFVATHYSAQTDSLADTKYCTPRIIGLSPTKLVSMSYEYASSSVLKLDTLDSYFPSTQTIKYNTGFRFNASLPLIVKPSIIFSLGLAYHDYKYQLADPQNTVNPFNNTLATNGLRSYGINATVFKPINKKLFVIALASFDYCGDYALTEAPNLNQLKTSAAFIVGVKKHERLQYGVGFSQAYKGGTLNYVALGMLNYTFKNTKWGVEMLLPTRANLRFAPNPKNLIYAGFELDGASYRLNNMMANSNLPYKDLELKRSEIKFRLKYDFAIYKLVWLSLQAGYRFNNNFKVDDGDHFRGYINKTPILMQNKLSSPLYFNIGLQLVAPDKKK